jgi:hypothetical protein
MLCQPSHFEERRRDAFRIARVLGLFGKHVTTLDDSIVCQAASGSDLIFCKQGPQVDYHCDDELFATSQEFIIDSPPSSIALSLKAQTQTDPVQIRLTLCNVPRFLFGTLYCSAVWVCDRVSRKVSQFVSLSVHATWDTAVA